MRDRKELIKDLHRQGFVVQIRRSGHLKVFHPERRGVVFMSSTPSDTRSIKNATVQLKKIGYRP